MTPKVLIVDDDPPMLDGLRLLLSREGYTVAGAASFTEAVARLDEAWDVAVVDQKLTGIGGPDDGLDLLQEIGRRVPEAKIIVLTAYVREDAMRRAFADGAYDYLEKAGQFEILLGVKVRNAADAVLQRRLANLTPPAIDAELAESWKATRAEPDRNKKGKGLEQVVALLLRSLPGFANVRTNVRTDLEEIDVVVRNESPDPFWSKQGSYFLTECKNWSKPVGAREVEVFYGKLARRFGQCRIGFFVAVNGFTEPFDKMLLQKSEGDRLVVPISGDDVSSLVTSSDRNALLKEFVERAMMMGNGH